MIYYVLFCLQCDEDIGMPVPFPFLTPKARGQWASEHTKGTGHDNWLVIDQHMDGVTWGTNQSDESIIEDTDG